MTPTNLSARRAATAVAVKPSPSPTYTPAAPVRRRIGFIALLLLAVPAVLFAGLLVSLAQQAN